MPCVGEESAGKNADVGIGVVAAINRRSRAEWKDDSNIMVTSDLFLVPL
jgi:uncharacterized protein (UPF0254 family)